MVHVNGSREWHGSKGTHVDLSQQLLGQDGSLPLVVNPAFGGFKKAIVINVFVYTTCKERSHASTFWRGEKNSMS